MDSRDQTYRHEVAKLAKDVFRIFLEDTAARQAAEQTRLLGEVSALGNPGGYLPALTDLACKQLQKDIQTFARIHTTEFTRFRLPCDARVETEFELTAKQMAGATYSRIHGQLELIEGRTKRHLAIPAGSSYITRAIAASTNMALRKGKISLRRQRIRMNHAQRESVTDFSTVLRPRNLFNQRIKGIPTTTNQHQESSVQREPAMVLFNPSFLATIIHASGTPTERRWHSRIGGDCDRKGLFQSEDRVVLGDEIHCEFFDQPRIVVRVKPVFGSGAVAYWEAEIVPRSEWNPTANSGASTKAEESQLPVRKNPRYEAVDSALRSISQAQPTDQEEVFTTLDSRKIPFADAEPFRSSRGWTAGFKKDPAAARAWLSKRWAALGLRPFARGPKK